MGHNFPQTKRTKRNSFFFPEGKRYLCEKGNPKRRIIKTTNAPRRTVDERKSIGDYIGLHPSWSSLSNERKSIGDYKGLHPSGVLFQTKGKELVIIKDFIQVGVLFQTKGKVLVIIKDFIQVGIRFQTKGKELVIIRDSIQVEFCFIPCPTTSRERETVSDND